MVKGRKSQRFEDHLCPRLQVTDVSGVSVRVRYRPARVPRSCELSVGGWSLLREAGFTSLNYPTRLVAPEDFITQRRR
jgi:hypothetical protein